MDCWVYTQFDWAIQSKVSVRLFMKQIAIVLGLGISGLSACEFLTKYGFSLWAVDDNLHKIKDQEGIQALEKQKNVSLLLPKELFTKYKKAKHEKELPKISFLLASPGVPFTNPVFSFANENHIQIVNDVELALRELLGAAFAPIAITGSNGKTTTTLLTTHILNSSRHPAEAVGNVEVPILQSVQKAKDNNIRLVVEVSSFQLERMTTRAFSAATILNITPNHLDIHGSMDGYIKAKMRLASCLKENGALYLHERLDASFVKHLPIRIFQYGFSKESALYSDGKAIYFHGKKEVDLPDIYKNTFSHDVENFLAAYAMSRECDVQPDECIKAFLSFKKPPHRIQFIKSINDVSYYDDSKGTNVAATLAAVESIKKPIVLIAGGMHKGEGYSSWIKPFQKQVKEVLVIGQAAPLIIEDLRGKIPTTQCQNLEEAVKTASQIAKPGDAVLLSPGCSSYDMFKNYKERGLKFQTLVEEIQCK